MNPLKNKSADFLTRFLSKIKVVIITFEFKGSLKKIKC